MLGPLLARPARGRALRSTEAGASSSSANVTDVDVGGPVADGAG